MSEESNSTLKVPVFDGEEKNYQSWKIRFQDYACVKLFHTALKMSSDLPGNKAEIDTLDATDADEKKQIAAGKRIC